MTICNDIILDWNTLNKKNIIKVLRNYQNQEKRVCF